MLPLLGCLVLLVILIALVTADGVVQWAQQPASLATSPLEVVIKPNSSVVSVGKWLTNAGVGVQSQSFSLATCVTDNAKSLKVDDYVLETGTMPAFIPDKMARDKITHYVITVTEGWSMRQIWTVVDAEPAFKYDTAGLSNADLICKIGAPETDPEGLFFPDTCLFARDGSDMKLYCYAYQATQRRLNDA